MCSHKANRSTVTDFRCMSHAPELKPGYPHNKQLNSVWVCVWVCMCVCVLLMGSSFQFLKMCCVTAVHIILSLLSEVCVVSINCVSKCLFIVCEVLLRNLLNTVCGVERGVQVVSLLVNVLCIFLAQITLDLMSTLSKELQVHHRNTSPP